MRKLIRAVKRWFYGPYAPALVQCGLCGEKCWHIHGGRLSLIAHVRDAHPKEQLIPYEELI